MGWLIYPDARGKAIYYACKAWIALLPVVWWVKVDRQRARFPLPQRDGMLAAVITGTIVAAIMLVTYALVKEGD